MKPLTDEQIAEILRDPDSLEEPTPELHQAVREALPTSGPTPGQRALLSAYWDITCGDCETGRCHGDGPCGCDRHDVSVRWQARNCGRGRAR